MRQLAAEMFPFLRDVVLDGDNCYFEIMDEAKKHRTEILEIIQDKTIPTEWAYYWAKHVGDRDVMRERVTETVWVDLWRKYIDKEQVACGVKYLNSN